MPISSYTVLPEVAYQLSKRFGQIKTVLDVGIGFGIYGALVRNYLDSGVLPFKTRLDGVEAWAKYRNPMWANYHHVYEQPLQDVKFERKYDFIIMCDVIEHFDKEEGKEQIKRLISQLNPKGQLIVSTPAIFCEQGAAHGNKFETHKSLWTKEDFSELGFDLIKNGKKDKWEHLMLCAIYEQS
jgi:2-polyprenyl-3-methyl-5-hydroxy-6-metoxy-1,4-benzoquinol methylase